MENQLIEDYLIALSSRSSTPGGGAVAALSGAQMAALVSMVCELTSSSDAQTKALVEAIRKRAVLAKTQFMALGAADIVAFKAVMAAYKLPKSIKTEKETQVSALQKALCSAAQAPLETLDLAFSLAEDITVLSKIGNPMLLSDVGIAALLLPATIQSAQMNVLINVQAIHDESFKQAAREKIEAAREAITVMEALAAEINLSLGA